MKNKYSKTLTLFALLLFSQIILGQNNINSFSPNLSFVDVNDYSVPTSPEPLTIELDSPAIFATFIPVMSSSPDLDVFGGGVTINTGQTSAVVLVNGISQSNSVTLTANLNGQTFVANVRVVGAAEVPQVMELNASEGIIPPGGSTSISVLLNIPADAGGSVIALTLTPTNAGTMPSSIFLPEGQFQGQFDYIDSNNVSNCSITAILRGTVTTNITMDSSLSIETTENPLSFSVFPNPFVNQLTFRLPPNQKSTVLIYNVLSQLVFEKDFFNSLTIETDNLKDGLYFYTIKDSQKKVIKNGKLIKSKN